MKHNMTHKIKQQMAFLKKNDPKFSNLNIGPCKNDISGIPEIEEAFNELKKEILVNESNRNSQ